MELWEKLKTQNVHVALQENTNICTSNSSTLEPKKQQKMPLQSKYTYTCMNADTGILSFDYLQQPQLKRRCGTCRGCVATDCSVCVYCKDKRKFGGPGRKKKGCIQRKCVFLSSGEASTVSLGKIKFP